MLLQHLYNNQKLIKLSELSLHAEPDPEGASDKV